MLFMMIIGLAIIFLMCTKLQNRQLDLERGKNDIIAALIVGSIMFILVIVSPNAYFTLLIELYVITLLAIYAKLLKRT